MHLLVAAHDLYPDPGSGGTGRYVYETGRRLAERGHEVTVLTRRRDEVPEVDAVGGMRVRRYDLRVDGEHALAVARQLPSAVSRVRDHLDDVGEPDALSLQATVSEPIVDALVPDRVPRTSVFHSPWPTEFAIKADREGPTGVRRRLNVGLRRAIERRCLARCERVVTLSSFMADRLHEAHPGVGDAHVVPGGVDPARFHPKAGRDERLASADPAFLTVRRLSPRMGHRQLVDAFARVVDEHPRAELFVAGDGPLREPLEQRVARRGLAERVRLLGYVPEAELPALFASADVLALPTQRLEGFGLATVEALASGTPVVATPVGATPEVLAPLRSEATPAPLLAEDAGPQAMAEAMAAWARAPPSERAEAGRRARRVAEERYAWERVVDELERVHERVQGSG